MSVTSISTADMRAHGAQQGGPPPGIKEAMDSVAASSGMSQDDLVAALARSFSVDDRA